MALQTDNEIPNLILENLNEDLLYLSHIWQVISGFFDLCAIHIREKIGEVAKKEKGQQNSTMDKKILNPFTFSISNHWLLN